MARNLLKKSSRSAKRANRPNPREDKNTEQYFDKNESHGNCGAFRLPKPRKTPLLLARNLTQESYIDALYDDNVDIVFASGSAGTGKSYVATVYAIQQLLAGRIDKIVVTRPMVEVQGENKLGALPGGISMKVGPWAAPILDIFKEFFDVATVNKMLETEVVELIPLSIMRGRSLKNSCILLDEAQNATPEMMLMTLTRIGEGSKMIITGDQRQNDLRGMSGLTDAITKLNSVESDRIAMITFSATDVERHPVIFDILKAYGHTD